MVRKATVRWLRCGSYDEARNYTVCLYVHEWAGKAYYVGKVGRAFFGGRYTLSYRHWIDGCLEHGGQLYIGTLVEGSEDLLDAVESILIETLKPPKNIRKPPCQKDVTLYHVGETPKQLQGREGPN